MGCNLKKGIMFRGGNGKISQDSLDKIMVLEIFQSNVAKRMVG